MDANDATPPGKIITFYSYKGGTGRSMALANAAWILASNGYRVLAVDWDLEAPGLHRYFAPFLLDHELLASDGVIDWLGCYADAVITPPETAADAEDDWFLRYADISRLATSLKWQFPGAGTLDFIGAGRQGPAYAGRVTNFPWQAFFERLGGGGMLNAARDCMREKYHYILLDSRTGVSDATGICTILMPDALVVCFTLNNQSIGGRRRSSARSRRSRRSRACRFSRSRRASKRRRRTNSKPAGSTPAAVSRCTRTRSTSTAATRIGRPSTSSTSPGMRTKRCSRFSATLPGASTRCSRRWNV